MFRKILLLLATCAVPGLAHAQDLKIPGLQEKAVDEFFGKAMRQAPTTRRSNLRSTALPVVISARLFLGEDQAQFRSEITVEGAGGQRAFETELEEGTVVFTDDGRGADLKAGDSIFSAFTKGDEQGLIEELQPRLKTSIEVLSGQSDALIEVGPRNLVPFEAAQERGFLKFDGNRDRLLDQGKRLSELRDMSQIAEMAKALDIDLKRTPILEIGRPALPGELKFDRFLDFPLIPTFPMAITVPVDREASLMVVDPGVVEDPSRTFDICNGGGAGTQSGAWTFAHLMREMHQGSNVATVEEFALQWLANWQIIQAPNGQLFNELGRGAQLQTRIIDFWDGRDGSIDSNFDIDLFPTRLMAIVNRPDLADRIGYGAAGSAGEGRFVFGLLGPGCSALPFTVIFEYGIKGGSCSTVKSYHQQWKDLDAHIIGSPTYNDALEIITRQFTDFGEQTSGESALNQLRTNENALNPLWQLLEFTLNGSGNLFLKTVKQSPDQSDNGTARLQAYMIADEADILADRHVVPERFPTMIDPFLAAQSDTPFGVIWNTPSQVGFTYFAETRRKTSLGTCSGCHAGETDTFFTHIGTLGRRTIGFPATLSSFLTGVGMPIAIPVTGGPITYADLQAREDKMGQILGRSCFSLLPFHSLPFVH